MLIVKIGYDTYAFEERALEYLRDARIVEEKRLNGKTYFLVEEKDSSISDNIRIVDNSKLKYKYLESDNQEIREAELKDLRKDSEQFKNWWLSEMEKTKDLETKLKVYEETCPQVSKPITSSEVPE